MERPKPLSHLRVLDLSRLLPGPMATLHLADLGADVIVIRRVEEEEPADHREALQRMLARNKRQIGLDLSRAEGRELFLRLAKEADVVMEGFRPGVVDRLGIGYAAVREVNPRIVYCSISGYGQDGPDRLRAGHDINYMANAGVGDQIGVTDGPPAIPNLQIGDLLGGSLTAVMGILAGVVDAQARGMGRYVDVAMTDSLMAHSVLALARLAGSGRTARRGEDILSGGVPCYGYYATSDGRYLAVGALERKFWERLCDAIRRPDLRDSHMAPGARNELKAIFGAQSSEYWMRVLGDIDCCVSVVLTLEEAIDREQTIAREMVVRRGEFVEFAPPLKMSDFDFESDPPACRGHSQVEGVLREAGFSAGQIASLRAARIVS